ncbi:HAD-IB family hydrolase [uncultured Clostridium sp.]|jgi:HAD superfamily hydrolase (TIGR01490 family)|uniref:HAD family hydrolase n=1 Tax=uncultured Clostridium sp. TaxID=59620 RepID=UPI002630F5A8|nr:HAD-IB family hydrolase [uncultured Clostridium sp.]
MISKKVAIFDIDKTIISGDSMFHLLQYTKIKYPASKAKLPSLYIKLVLYKLGLINTQKAKEAMFYTFNYLNSDDLKSFYNSILKEKIFSNALDKMKVLKNNGYFILLVSASPEAYLKYFEDEEYVNFVIGTKFKYAQNKVTNQMDGINCKGDEKVVRINTYLKSQNISIDKENSVAFSDSLSDTPMFNLVKKAYLINFKKNNDTYEVLKWK